MTDTGKFLLNITVFLLGEHHHKIKNVEIIICEDEKFGRSTIRFYAKLHIKREFVEVKQFQLTSDSEADIKHNQSLKYSEFYESVMMRASEDEFVSIRRSKHSDDYIKGCIEILYEYVTTMCDVNKIRYTSVNPWLNDRKTN